MGKLYNEDWTHVDITAIENAIIKNGVVTGLEVTESSTPAMTVLVSAGQCTVDGVVYSESSGQNLNIGNGDSTYDRKDIVVYDTSAGNPAVVAGTPAVVPHPEDVPDGDILLGIVLVEANETTSIVNADITDDRFFAIDRWAYTEVSTNTTLNDAHKVVCVDATGGARTITLPTAVGVRGKVYVIKKTDSSSNAVTIDGNGAETIEGSATYSLSSQYDTVIIQCTNAGWITMSSASMTNNEIRDAVEAATDSNTFTDADHTKLNGVADGATKYPDTGQKAFTDDDNTKLDGIATGANNYSHPSARVCSSGNWAWASISGKPSTYTPSAHNQSASTITSGTLSVARGGTGVTGDSYDADKVDGCHAGISTSNVFKIGANHVVNGTILYGSGTGIWYLSGGTNGYQLTTHGSAAPTWSAASDLIWSDTHCPKCGKEFKDGEILVLYITAHNEVGDILTIPMHQECTTTPKKKVMLQREVYEDKYILDEDTGDIITQRTLKTKERTVTKHRLKEGCKIDTKTGEIKKAGVKVGMLDAVEDIEETVTDIIYEDVEFEL